jgi:ATP-dependent Clp protease adapter protein ClpS
MSIFNFDINDFTDIQSQEFIDEKLKELLKPKHPGMYSVILHNDPINGVEFVTKVIKDVFSYSTSKAVWLMFKAHFTGKSILWVGEHAQANNKKSLMINFGADPNMIDKNAKPLKISVEKND